MSPEEAKKRLLERLDQELSHEQGAIILKKEKELAAVCDAKAKEMLVTSIQRFAAAHTAEATTSTVDIPSDEMKGRIIGREGRNIRAFEKATGVDVIIDDTPGVVIVSGFDPVRREIARMSLNKLIADGRIHPSRIEELVAETKRKSTAQIRRYGEEAVQETQVHGLNEKVVNLLGRLHYRTSYSQNVLRHSIEVSFVRQYRYHAKYRARRDEDKFDRLLAFGLALPRMRARCDADLATTGLSRAKVLAAVVRLLELTLIRVGNEEYARLNRSFGADHPARTTRGRGGHERAVPVQRQGGRRHEVSLRDRRLAAVVRRCQDLPGQDLFQYEDDEGVHDVTAADVNDYIRDATGGPFTAKDLRTWAGTVLAHRAMRHPAPDAPTDHRRAAAAAVRVAADHLGNTPAVAALQLRPPGGPRGANVGPTQAEDLGRPSGPDDEHSTWPDLVEEAAVIRLLRREASGSDDEAPWTGPRRRSGPLRDRSAGGQAVGVLTSSCSRSSS